MSRYRVVIVKLEEPDGTVIEKKWAVYDSESGVVLTKRYDLPFDAENEATALKEELDVANAELFENLKGFTDDPEQPGYKP